MTLVDALDEHPAEFRYDWRTRFGMSLTDALDGGMTWREMWELFLVLRRDPTSWVAAVLQGWEHPTSHDALVLADTYDLHVAANSDPKKGRAKPYPRVWDKPDRGNRTGDTSKFTQAQVRAILRARGARSAEEKAKSRETH